ncbi:MAG: YdeI/OmpD-associated family protein [Anaerolineales bacterium]|nr:YdeI/OmpD-associated family protein [Anaerolineales bacterium]
MRDNRIGASANVIVNLSPEGPQGNNLAEDIAKAISDSPNADAFFNGLPTFYRKNYIRWIEGAKRDETRAKRIGEMINLLENGKREK